MTRLSFLVILIPMFSTRWKKKILVIIITISSLWSFSYAEETPPCITCSSMAPELQSYISFANQIIDAIEDKKDLMSRWSTYNVFWPWQWGNYNGILVDKNPSGIIQSIVLWTLKNLDKRQSQLRATTEILSIYTMDIVLDGALWFLVASQPWPIMRDFQYLLDIDTLISDKIYDLWAMGVQGKQLTTQERATIIGIIESNSGPWKLLEDDYNLDPALNTTEVLRLLLRINTRNKKALTLSTTDKDNTIKVGKSTFTLSEKNFLNLVENYRCVRILNTNSCWWSFANFKKSIDNITKSFIETWPKQSRDRINTAYKKLLSRGKIIMNKDIDEKQLKEYLIREHELISSRGDGASLVKRSWWWILTGLVQVNIPREIWETWKEIITSWGIAGNARTTTKKIIKKENMPENNLTNKQEKSLAYPLTTPQSVISDELKEVMRQHQEASLQQLKVNTQDSQDQLQKIAYRLRIINDVLSTSIKDDLTRTCNLQCSNLWWVCG